jgi:hypothetical protein
MAKARRGDEEHARSSLDRWLNGRGHGPRVWSDGDDPPDYFLSLGDQRYAVEVTQVQQEFALGAGTMSERDVTVGLTNAIRELERRALAKGILSGFYFVHLEPLPDLKAELAGIETRLVEYLTATRDLETAPRGYLREGPWGRQWTIRKVARKGAELSGSVGYHGIGIGEGEYMMKLRERLRAILARKREQLSGLAESKVLLLLDKFHYAEDEQWLRLASETDMSSFHSVARSHREGACQVLYSSRSGWREGGAQIRGEGA